jgi:hypothetical protein
MKKKADLNATRDREKQMWTVVNEKRDVKTLKSPIILLLNIFL